jgi:hypothetical protein
MRWLLLFGIGMLLLAGCAKGTEQADEPKSAAVKADSAARLETDVISNREIEKPINGIVDTALETTLEDRKLNLNFVVRNISGDDLVLSFGSGQQYDFVVYDSRNEEVYRWSNDKAFTLALVEMDLRKGDSLSYAESWDLKDNDGNPVPKGAYTIKVWITAHVIVKDAKASPEGMEAEAAIELS